MVRHKPGVPEYRMPKVPSVRPSPLEISPLTRCCFAWAPLSERLGIDRQSSRTLRLVPGDSRRNVAGHRARIQGIYGGWRVALPEPPPPGALTLEHDDAEPRYLRRGGRCEPSWCSRRASTRGNAHLGNPL